MATPVTPILRECHRLRRHLRELQLEIDRGPRTLKIQQTKLAAADAAHAAAYDHIKAQKLKQKADEGSLKTIEGNISRLETRAMQVTTMKEMDATRSELAQAAVKKNAFEDEVLTVMTDVEERTADLPAVEKTWAAAKAEFAEYEADAKDRMVRLLADQAECTTGLTAIEKTIPDEVRGQYDRLVRANGADGFAAVVGRVCQHCRTTLTEQQRNELFSGRFMCCPSCFRAMYLAE